MIPCCTGSTLLEKLCTPAFLFLEAGQSHHFEPYIAVTLSDLHKENGAASQGDGPATKSLGECLTSAGIAWT